MTHHECEWHYIPYKPEIDYGIPKIAPQNTTKESQVVTATINSALSRQREPESDPVRLQN